MLLYSFVLGAVLLLASPVWLVRMFRQGRYREGLRERLGVVPLRLQQYVSGHQVVWVHAVSVGETLAAVRLVRELEKALPGCRVVLSTTTPTGQQIARERFGVDRVFFYPLDFAFAVGAYLRALRPALLVLMESELWPRMLVECERERVPVAVVNARVSDRSLPRYLALCWLWKPLLGKLALLLAQSEQDRERWLRIGAPEANVQTTGNLKYDIATQEESPLAALLRKHLPAGARVLVAGSTHAGEEAMLLDCYRQLLAHRPALVMVLAPRHPQRSEAVAADAQGAGLTCIPLTQWRLAPAPVPAGSVLLVDTVGELASLYRLASIAFVGGSIVPHGGQNPLEPAQFGIPVLMGPHYENFRTMVDGMIAANAIAIAGEHELFAAMETALQGNTTGANARAFFVAQAGATGRTVQQLLPLVHEQLREERPA